jgi:GDP/UDP-N,N'-diacetylbacillosamine 2-epimerase (hydrolysing)
VTGEPGLTDLSYSETDEQNFLISTGISRDDDFAICALHPSPYETINSSEQAKQLLESLSKYAGKLLITAPNQDQAAHDIAIVFVQAAQGNPNIHYVSSLGRTLLNVAMARADFIIGNSSTALMEAPSFRLPAINIGKRQEGRITGCNVVNVGFQIGEIRKAVSICLTTEFRSKCDGQNPYVNEKTLDLIVEQVMHDYPKDLLLNKRIQLPQSEYGNP